MQLPLLNISDYVSVFRESRVIMSQRLRWLLPALIVSWTSLQLGVALPAHDEHSHVSADTFDRSTATSTIIRQQYDGRALHPPYGKNETQSSHKLVASPAGLLRPDKFQFYTYDDKGDMITRQMTAQEIQGLIASGGTDHIAMDRQEPQKADDVLTGGKKVMDVVQKVQNVLKSALDKPPTLTGSIPKIPEHANVEWSNILPSILSGEADSISPNSDSSQLSHKLTTEKVETESASKHPTKKPATFDVQTNAYAGFTNNVQGKPHYSQQTPATEKPMIPVPVITLTELKLSTLQSAVTESPVFQIVSVIPVESAGIKESQTDPSTAASSTVQLSAQTEESSTEHPVTSTYGENYFNPLPTEIQSSASIEPLPTQLIDAFSSVINQVSEVKPPVLPLSSPSNETPVIPILNINYEQRRNVSETNEKNVRPVINTQTYETFATEIPSRDTTTKFVDYSVTYRPVSTVDREPSTSSISENSRIKATTASTKVGTTNNRVTSNNLATTPSGLKSTQIQISGSTASSFVQLDKTHATAASLPASQTISPATLQGITERIALEKTSTTSYLDSSDSKTVTSDATKTQPTTASIDTSLSLNKSTTVESFSSTLANLNLSDPVSAIDKVISIAPLPSSTSAIKPIDLPDNISNFVVEIAGDIASGLIAGFPTTNAPNLSTIEEEKIKNVTKLHETERNVTQSTQEALTDPVRNGTLIYGTLTQTKESNDTLEPTNLSSSNERIDDSTKATLSSPVNQFTNVNGQSKDTIKQNATTVGIVSVTPEQTTTTTTINVNTNNNQKKTESKEKVKTTEAPIVQRTDLSPELSNQLSVKVANGTKTSEHAGSSSKIEALNEKNGSFANVSSITKDTVVIHSINDSISESSSQAYSDVTRNTSLSNVTSDGAILTNRNSTDPALPQKPNRVTSTADKNKDKEHNKNNESSSVPVQGHTNSSVKITQDSTNDANGSKGDTFRPDNLVNNTSSQSDKNVTQTTSTANASIQNDEHSNNTESKTASLKHSESTPKPDVIRLQASTSPSSVPVLNHAQASSSLPPFNSNDNTHIRSPGPETSVHQQEQPHPSSTFLPLDASQSAIGLDATIRHTSADIVNFAKLCNELAFNFWVATNKGLSTARSLALSPFGMTSLLAMIFLGARGPTSDQMNEVLGLDDVATFNPHLVFQNITDAVGLARGQGIANAAFVRELFADKMKVRKLMPFYKEQAQQFYEGLVTEVNFATISDLVRRRTNLLVRKQTGGRIKDFVKTNTVPLRSPLAALSANVFQTDCNSSLTSSVGRDGELYFAVSPAVRQRKLVPVPATTWRSAVLAGYEPSIDATAVALGGSDKLVSTIFVLPGQQGHTAPGDTLDRLEQRLVRSAFRDGAWNKLLKVLIPRHGLELQVPKFSHRSVVNATAALKRMGLDELFSGNADFKGINGVGHRLHLADVLQMNLFSTCGDENILSGRHHVETYPASPLRRNVERRTEDDNSGGNAAEEDTLRYGTLPQEDNIDSYVDQSRTVLYGFYREERQLSGSLERPRLKLDRPFLYFVRHNPSGIILHMGRFNPRLLP
ncbi:Serpin B6 [Cyphomyrmex costatus]|uniref:Serpin B6 n=1 Tax=Cyphomyrmex costatus TaxID=456900 RepID=A0A195CBJ7_9HYME|nr:Serpin B6 [Cyphomyrmex costatus]